MFLHAADAVNQSHKRIILQTVDSDVLVLATAVVQKLQQHHPTIELWVAYSTGKNLRYFEAHKISAGLGEEISKGLPFFHAFTGCDTVSSFAGKEKKSAWTTWISCTEETKVFSALASVPDTISDEWMSIIERCVILMYDRTSIKDNVNDARMQLFCQKGRTLEGIPPTQTALLQHTKRAVCTRLVIAGDKHSWSDQICRLHMNGVQARIQAVAKVARATVRFFPPWNILH